VTQVFYTLFCHFEPFDSEGEKSSEARYCPVSGEACITSRLLRRD